MQKTIASGKPGEIFYKIIGDMEVAQIIDIKEGYVNGFYKDPNANTIHCWGFISQNEFDLDSRSIMAERYYWDMGNTYMNESGFNDRRTDIIQDLFDSII